MNIAVREIQGEEIARRFPHLAAGAGACALVLEGGDGVIAASPERFDSEHLGKQIAWVRDLRVPSPAAGAVLAGELAARLKRQGCDHLLRRVHAADFDEIWALERAGFELVDISVTLALALDGSRQAGQYDDLIVRPARRRDAGACVDLMAGEWWGGRYDNDPRYDRQGVRTLRARWMENDFAGRAQVFLVGEMQGEIAGYMSGLLDASSRMGKIDLVATVPRFRRRRVAARILEHLLAWFSQRADRVTVPTQATNYPAVQLYQRAGFLLDRTEIIYRLDLTSPVEKST